MDNATRFLPSHAQLRGEVLAVDLVRACARHDTDDVSALLVELRTAIGPFPEGLALYRYAEQQLTYLLAELLGELGVTDDDFTGTTPTAALSTELQSVRTFLHTPGEVTGALEAFATGDLGPLAALKGLDRLIGMALAVAMAARAHWPAAQVTGRLDALRRQVSA